MQKLTIRFWNGIDKDATRKTAKFNIGDKVYVINWHEGNPNILEAYVLFIGVESPLQPDDLMYILNKNVTRDDLQKYYESDVYASRSHAAKAIMSKMKLKIKYLKEAVNHPFYKYGETP